MVLKSIASQKVYVAAGYTAIVAEGEGHSNFWAEKVENAFRVC